MGKSQKVNHPQTGLDRPLEPQGNKGPWISRQSAHKCGKVVSPMHWPPTAPRNIPGTHFCHRLSRTQCHGVAKRLKSMKNPNDPIGNRTRDLRACNTFPQSTATPCTRIQRVPESFLTGGKAAGAWSSHWSVSNVNVPFAFMDTQGKLYFYLLLTTLTNNICTNYIKYVTLAVCLSK
jgi:hypothetical protein